MRVLLLSNTLTAIISRPCPLRRFARAAAIVFIVAAGAGVGWWLVVDTDREMRSQVLIQAQVAAAVINPEAVQSLTGTDADAASPTYLKLKEQLASIREADPKCRFVYLLGQKADGRVFFFVDSEPVGSPEESPPGQPYQEISAADLQVFRTETACVTGPTKDRWGTWITALVPLHDLRSNRLTAVLGVDIDARDWAWNVASRAAFPNGVLLILSLGLLAAILMALTSAARAARRPGPHPSPTGQERSTVPAMAEAFTLPRLLIGMAALSVAFLAVVLYQTIHWSRKHIDQTAQKQAALAVAFNAALRDYIAEHVRPEMEKRVRPGEFIPETMSTSFASRRVFEKVKEFFPFAIVRFPSRNPLNPVNQATPAEEEIIRFFERNPEAASWTGTIKFAEDGEEYSARALPRRFKTDCLKCHGDPQDAPPSIVERYGSTAGFGHAEGDVSLDLAAIPTKAAHAEATSAIHRHMMSAAILCVLFIVGTIGLVWTDHTQKRRSQAALRHSQEHLAAILRSIGEGVIACDRAGTVTSINRSAETLTGWTAAEAIGRPLNEVFQIIHIRTRQAVESPVVQVLSKGEAAEQADHIVLISREGTERHIAQSCTPVQDADGNITGAVLVFRDVTAECRQREALRESQERFEQLAELTRTFTWEIDVDGVYTYVSPVVESVLGYQPDELVGKKRFYDLHPEDGKEGFKATVFGIMRQGGSFVDLENAAVANDGGLVWLSTNGIPIFHDDGTLRGYRGSDRDVTAIKEAEAKLRLGEEKYRLLITHATSGIAVHEITWDETGKPVDYVFLDANPAFETHTGLQVADILGRRVTEVIPGIEKTPLLEIYGDVVRTGQPATFEFFSKHLGRHYSISAYKIENNRFAAIFTDISEQKRMERTLRDNEATLRSITDAAREAIIMIDAEGAVTFWNPAATAILGYSLEEALGHNLHDLIAPARMIEAHRNAFAEFVKASSGESLGKTLELTAKRKDGREIPVELSISAVSRNGSRHAVGILRDITERKAAETQLKEQRNLLQTILDGIPDVIALKTRDLSVVSYNKAGYELLGLTSEQVKGKKCHELLCRPAPCENCPSMESQATQGVATRELFFEELGRWFRATSIPIVDDHGEIRLIVEQLHDITQKKYAELELKGTVEALESAYRTLEELYQIAESATKAKSQFLANMSHEIRTPLTAILGFTEILLGDPSLEQGPPERVDALLTIERNGKYLLALINDILDLSKIEAGKLEVERIACSPVQIVADVASLMRVRAAAKNLPLNVTFAGKIPATIHTDPVRLRQILINLIGNAIKFTEAGEVRVETRLVQGGERPPMIQIDVIDTGIGLSAEHVARLFQPFSQADSSTTRKYGGTGLGLAISKRLAEMLGGDITVQSVLGRGSTFSVTVAIGDLTGVPMLESPSLETGVSRPAPSTNFSSAVPLQCRILLAEDGPDNQRLIRFILEKAGARVTIVGNGQEAVEAALAACDRREPFDVILMDMQMPVMDGYTATARLREVGYAGLIVALTAHAMEGDDLKCRDAGCDGYLTKPIERAKFLATIARLLEDRQSLADQTAPAMSQSDGGEAPKLDTPTSCDIDPTMTPKA